MKLVLITSLGLLAVWFMAVVVISIRRSVEKHKDLASDAGLVPNRLETLIGFVATFFDTLGIGSFAPTTAWFRNTNLVPDELIPGTMNVGYALPTILTAYIFIDHVDIEPVTLLSMIVASVLGAWLGAGIVARLPRKRIQIGMGSALIIAGLLMVASQLNLKSEGAQALGLELPMLILACLVMAILGALMTIGVGLYAPCMILVSLMGMNPLAAFPIMMGACAFLMPVASVRFVHSGKQLMKVALGMTLGGLPAVLIAAFLVKSLPLYYLKWLVVVVVLFTAGQMLRSALAPKRTQQHSYK